ncbi:AcrR family transcriptional regulator [Phenylobacterium koreense]|uniref:AcrR family transcriptional regulator n=1 Tax=Phenylobacterium koreense TaxID=266125 RepID=A0ABV2EHI0_9CAUL
MAVIAEKGPDACSIEDFVAAAGVSRGTFYNYYPTTEDLLRAVQIKVGGELSAVLDKRLPLSLPPSNRLATRMHSHMLSVTRDPVWGWVMMRLDGSRLARVPVIQTDLDRIYQDGLSKGEFRELDPSAVRTLVFGASRMVQRDILMGLTAPAHAEQVVALVLTALGVTYEEALKTSAEAAALALEIHDAA